MCCDDKSICICCFDETHGCKFGCGWSNASERSKVDAIRAGTGQEETYAIVWTGKMISLEMIKSGADLTSFEAHRGAWEPQSKTEHRQNETSLQR